MDRGRRAGAGDRDAGLIERELHVDHVSVRELVIQSDAIVNVGTGRRCGQK